MLEDVLEVFNHLLWHSNNNHKKVRKTPQISSIWGVFSLVRMTGLEPARRETLEPKSSASANSATSAYLFWALTLAHP